MLGVETLLIRVLVLGNEANENRNGYGFFVKLKNSQFLLEMVGFNARAIVDLVDLACIMSRPSPEELKTVAGFQKVFSFAPNCVTDIFKNRRGRWNQVRIWSKVDLGVCRRYDLFVTTPSLEEVQDFQVVDFIQEKSQEMIDLESLYNDGIVSDEMEQDLIERFSSQEEEVSLLDEVAKAFGDENDRKEQLKNVSFDDLL